MWKVIRRSAAMILGIVMLLSVASVSADSGHKFQIFFAPHVMNDTTGEIAVDVNIRNYNIAVHNIYGDMCGLTFSFEYNSDNFKIKRDANKNIELIAGEGKLLKDLSVAEIKENGNVITFTFADTSFENNVINKDGTLFSFTLISKETKKFWNSFDRYRLNFVPGSIGVVTYNKQSRKVSSFYNFEGLDCTVGAYNGVPAVQAKSVDKHFSFTVGNKVINVNDAEIETDAAPYIQDGAVMLPLRALAENIGMTVEWNDAKWLASGYTDCKTISVSLKNGRAYVNSVPCGGGVKVALVNGRTYVSSDVVSALYPNAQVETDLDKGTVEVYIP